MPPSVSTRTELIEAAGAIDRITLAHAVPCPAHVTGSAGVTLSSPSAPVTHLQGAVERADQRMAGVDTAVEHADPDPVAVGSAPRPVLCDLRSALTPKSESGRMDVGAPQAGTPGKCLRGGLRHGGMSFTGLTDCLRRTVLRPMADWHRVG